MCNATLLHFLRTVLAGRVNRHQQAIIDYLMEENRIFKHQIQGRRLNLSDNDRRRLGARAKALGRQVLKEVANLVTRDTLLVWYRNLVARKWTYAWKGPGWPRVSKEMTELVLCMASDHPSWGYDRRQSALANLGHIVSSHAVGNILKCHGIEPAPERGKRTSWRRFVKAHWDVMAATDFFTNEAWSAG